MVEKNFGWALGHLNKGAFVARAGWNGKGMFLGLQLPDSNSANTLPYIWMRTADGHRVPWLASQTDMLSTDWDTLPASWVELRLVKSA